MIDPRTHVEMCNAEFVDGRASRDADVADLKACAAHERDELDQFRKTLLWISQYKDRLDMKNLKVSAESGLPFAQAVETICYTAHKALSTTQPKEN